MLGHVCRRAPHAAHIYSLNIETPAHAAARDRCDLSSPSHPLSHSFSLGLIDSLSLSSTRQMWSRGLHRFSTRADSRTGRARARPRHKMTTATTMTTTTTTPLYYIYIRIVVTYTLSVFPLPVHVDGHMAHLNSSPRPPPIYAQAHVL